jgi:hypothetical protein
MADQISGYLQKKIDSARRADIQARLGQIRKVTCYEKNNASIKNINNSGTNSGYLQKRIDEIPVVYPMHSKIQTSVYLQTRIDALNDVLKETDRFEAVALRRPIPACTLPSNTIYNAGLPIPVPKFRCALINNMMTF